jgi:diguanylate cyclase (GGDEF)-like protein
MTSSARESGSPDVEALVLQRWKPRFAPMDEVPNTGQDIVRPLVRLLMRGQGSSGDLVDAAHAFGVFRAQQGHDVRTVLEDVLLLRSLTWGTTATNRGGGQDPGALLLAYDRLTELLDLVALAAVDACVEETTRVLAAQATHDPLTGLVNRAHLDEAVRRALAHRDERHLPALIIIDLDGFKQVNDRYGHLAGDELLAGIARVLQASSPQDAVVARLGGDEFAVLLAESGPRRAAAVAHRLLSDARRAPVLRREDAPVRLSIGAACLPLATTASLLFAAADAAMYRAKTAGGDRTDIATDDDLEAEPAPAVPMSQGQRVRRDRQTRRPA